MTTWITICDTCKRDGWDAAAQPLTDGETLAERIEALAKAPLRTRRVSCMMGCQRACNVAIQGDGKLWYVLGLFAPDDDAAAAIVEYAMLYDASDTGQVPYRTWPAGVKGHFTARTAPLPTGG